MTTEIFLLDCLPNRQKSHQNWEKQVSAVGHAVGSSGNSNITRSQFSFRADVAVVVVDEIGLGCVTVTSARRAVRAQCFRLRWCRVGGIWRIWRAENFEKMRKLLEFD